MSAPIREPDGRPSKDGPLSNAPRKVRHAEFAGDVAIAERGRLAPSRDRKYVLAGLLAGVAMVTAVAFIGYRLSSAPPPGSPPHALPASQPDQRTLASKPSVADAPHSAEPALASPAATNAITLPSDEQKSRDIASPPATAEPRQHSASEISAMMRSGAELIANGDVSGARLMYQRLAKEGEASAALALAETYDPSALRKSNIARGVTPDVALAQSWYEKAKALGSSVAAERLEVLARLDKVTLITDFGYNGRHAYFFDALDRGYYRDAGLEVKIVRGKGSVDAIRQVGAGNAMFGFADAGSLILARANDQIPVKLVAIVYRKPPQAIFCREDSGLKKPKDLEGNAIANPAGGSIPDLFPAFAKAAGIDAQTVRWVVASSESLPGLLAANKVPCVGQFTVGEALLRSQLGFAKLIRFAYSDAGLSYYGNGIVATAATITSKPDLVHRFVEATVRGMKDAFADSTAAGAIMHKIVPEMDAAIIKSETEAVAELAQIPGQPLGEIDPARIDATLDVVKDAFKLAAPVAAADVYAPGFVSK
jgi:NitT/TauT family transport system substrate-binding protein